MTIPDRTPIISTRVIIEHGPDIVVVQRAQQGEFQGSWELPGGKVDQDEDIAQGALREVGEEIGVPVELLPFQPELIEDRRIPDGKHFGRQYKAYGFIGIASSREVILNPDEHQNSLWLPAHEALQMHNLSQTSRNTLRQLGAICSPYIKKPSV
jgi:8-oxo-dGTP pyrophosphatase MutT (NUDIX family)